MDQAEKLRNLVSKHQEKDVFQSSMSTRVIAITSGKGGVGKTNVAVNLAVHFRKQNMRVVLIDADFGLANVEVLFGLIPKYSFADVLSGKKRMDEVLTKGPMDILFISGGSGLGDMANLNHAQMSYLIENFAFLDTVADIILIDTGAGISNSVVNFIKASNETIIITTPEPTSITDAYAIIKTVKESKMLLPSFKIIVNRADDEQEGQEIFDKLSRVSEKFLQIQLENLGTIPFDRLLIKAVKRQEPVSTCFPDATSSKAIGQIGLRLLNLSVTKGNSQDGIISFVKRLANIFSN